MASITFSVEAKGRFEICDNKQVLHELGVLFLKMWNGCENGNRCEHCKKKIILLWKT